MIRRIMLWIALAVIAWIVVGFVVGLLIGAAIRRADQREAEARRRLAVDPGRRTAA